VARIKNRKECEEELDEMPDWRIDCCYLGKGHRRHRRTRWTARIAGLGGGTVEGCPEPAGDVPAGFRYHGVLFTFERAGFRRVRTIGKRRWLVATEVARN
jgi:hypothetical protein